MVTMIIAQKRERPQKGENFGTFCLLINDDVCEGTTRFREKSKTGDDGPEPVFENDLKVVTTTTTTTLNPPRHLWDEVLAQQH